jgi:hypothetical protein
MMKPKFKSKESMIKPFLRHHFNVRNEETKKSKDPSMTSLTEVVMV